jgi:F-type H+-transporting ATPase subunit a
MALAVAAFLLPAHPLAAASLAAGQILSALNFFFLEKLVKLFTEAAVSKSPAEATLLRARLLLLAPVKMAVIYGGAFALTRWRSLELWPLVAGLSLPLAALFFKAAMLAVSSGPENLLRRAPSTAGSSGNLAKPAAFILLAAFLALSAPPAWSQEAHVGPAAGESAPGHAPEATGLSTSNPDSAAASMAHVAEGGAAHGAEGAGHGGEGAEGGAQHLPNWITILNDFFPQNSVIHWMHENEYLVFAWLAAVVFLAITWIGMRKPKMVPGQIQNAIEWMVESMEDVCGGMLGKHLHKYFPYIIAVFFYVLSMNLIGIIPGFKSSTSTLDVTLALALITFLYVQFTGLRNLGLLGYIDHLAGSPRDVVGFIMLPVMIPVHILGELAKPVSLSCRLFGNIFGEDTLIVVFVGATALCLKASLVALAVPPMLGISALFMLLQALTSIVQALIFALLATVYLYMMLPHEEHAHGNEEHAHGSSH